MKRTAWLTQGTELECLHAGAPVDANRPIPVDTSRPSFVRVEVHQREPSGEYTPIAFSNPIFLLPPESAAMERDGECLWIPYTRGD